MKQYNTTLKQIKKTLNKKKQLTNKTKHKLLNKPSRTYYIKSEYYSPKFVSNILRRLAPQYNWRQIVDLEPFIKHNRAVDFVYVDGKYRTNKSIYTVKSAVKNIVSTDKRSITLKHNLIRNLKNIPEAAQFLLDQLEIDLSDANSIAKIREWYQPGKIYIFKPISEYSGVGIKVIETLAVLEEYIKTIIADHQSKWEQKERDRMRIWVLQEYITNPLLINGYKFHVRNYLFYIPKGGSFYLKQGEIATANEPFKLSDWSNPKIHDTHFYGKDGDIFPDALHLSPEHTRSIYSQLDIMYKSILKCINADCYSESKKCFELFGIDFIILDNYQIKLIEVNEKIGMPSETSVMTQEIFKNIIKKIII